MLRKHGQEISILIRSQFRWCDGRAVARGGQAWLEITVGGETLSPRERLVSVPFALRAGVAESITNKPERILLNNL